MKLNKMMSVTLLKNVW